MKTLRRKEFESSTFRKMRISLCLACKASCQNRAPHSFVYSKVKLLESWSALDSENISPRVGGLGLCSPSAPVFLYGQNIARKNLEIWSTYVGHKKGKINVRYENPCENC